MDNEMKAYLRELNDHPYFQKALEMIPKPQIQRYRPGKVTPSDWEYFSGRADEYDSILQFLKGEF